MAEFKKKYKWYPLYVDTADKIGQIKKLRGYPTFTDTADDLISNRVKITLKYAEIKKEEEVEGVDKVIEIVKGAINE